MGVETFEQVLQLDAFLASPFGRYFTSETFFVWCRDPQFCGSVVFGRFEKVDELERLAQALDFVSHPQMPPYRALSDLRRVVVLDPAPFLAVSALLERQMPLLTRLVQAQAILLPEDPFSAALVRGYFESLPLPFKCFADAERDAAFAWLGEAPSFLGVLDGVYTSVISPSSCLMALRRHIGEHYATANLTSSGRALGVSPRSLQRELQAANTSFQHELRRVRLAIAEKLLLTTETKVSAIAKAVGYKSPGHFARAFRSVHGHDPSTRRGAKSQDVGA